MRDISHDQIMIKRFREDPGYAVELLNSVIQDGSPDELRIVLHYIAHAFGGIQRQSPPATCQGNISEILQSLNLQLDIHPARQTPVV